MTTLDELATMMLEPIIKLDDLEALLIERAENLNDPEAYHGDIAEVMLKAADAIAELREKNAGLENDIELAIILLGQAEPPRDDPDMEWAPLVHSLTSAYKENTQ